MTNDDYVKIEVIFIHRTGAAICCTKVNNDPESPTFWIPVSLIHGGDLLRIDNNKATEVIEFRLREWKAEELDL